MNTLIKALQSEYAIDFRAGGNSVSDEQLAAFIKPYLDRFAAEHAQRVTEERRVHIKEPLRGDMEKAVVGALRSSIAAHGHITNDNASSAGKRIIGQIKCFGRQERDDLRARLAASEAALEEAKEKAKHADDCFTAETYHTAELQAKLTAALAANEATSHELQDARIDLSAAGSELKAVYSDRLKLTKERDEANKLLEEAEGALNNACSHLSYPSGECLYESGPAVASHSLLCDTLAKLRARRNPT